MQKSQDLSPEAVLSIKNLFIEFPIYKGSVKALNGVNLEVYPGEIIGLVGESGSGKSVTAMMSNRLIADDAYQVKEGSIHLLGKNILSCSESDMLSIRGKQIAMIFQEPMTALNPVMKVGKQLLGVILRHQAISTQAAKDKAIKLLRDMEIGDPEQVFNSYPFELSGGMRQRIMIALAFSCDPQLLIADEPTTALDVTVQKQVLLLLRERAQQTGTAILLITHDLAVVSQFCERVYVMYAGSIVEEGLTQEVLHSPKHPYTRGLLAGLPEKALAGELLATIPGQVPNLAQLPEGCSFMGRCAERQEICQQRPSLLKIKPSSQHKTACWVVQQGGK